MPRKLSEKEKLQKKVKKLKDRKTYFEEQIKLNVDRKYYYKIYKYNYEKTDVKLKVMECDLYLCA